MYNWIHRIYKNKMINYKEIKKKLKNIGLINLIYRRYVYPYLYQSEFDLKIIKKLNIIKCFKIKSLTGKSWIIN